MILIIMERIENKTKQNKKTIKKFFFFTEITEFFERKIIVILKN